jgi:hypothetical protein
MFTAIRVFPLFLLGSMALANESIVSGSIDQNRVKVCFFGGSGCEGELSAEGTVTQFEDLYGDKFEGIKVQIVAKGERNCANNRAGAFIKAEAALSDLIAQALQSIPQEKRALPVSVLLPRFVFSYGIDEACK